uniref:Uncharacterized protein n=1 Tax=Micrurus spixii TaxID=129469 RepID=A0A2D4LRP2_9SAUR
MVSFLEEFKKELKRLKEEAQEGKGDFGFVFQFFEMEILDYEKQREMSEEEEGWDKEEAIFNDQVTLCGGKREKGGKRVKNLRVRKTTKTNKRKNSLRNNYNIRKKQKRGLQRRELESEKQGVNGGNEKKTGKKEREREMILLFLLLFVY